LMSSSVMSMRRDRSVELPHRHTEGVSARARTGAEDGALTLSQLEENELVLLELGLLRSPRVGDVRFRESGRELEHGLI
jgi:hypothetical protein